ncbi:MAG TPA: hypothetical protein VFT22_36885 [Kofleriaceae bacterium]|nr:hypothetical protein [Kofleriaceae bacterium]
MRALWSFVVVCLVAASGLAHGQPRVTEPTAAVVRAAAAIVHAPATRSELQAASARARVPSPGLPPVALAAASSPRGPVPRAIARFAAAGQRVASPCVVSGSARGPPIG